jgi:hypothetical protein
MVLGDEEAQLAQCQVPPPRNVPAVHPVGRVVSVPEPKCSDAMETALVRAPTLWPAVAAGLMPALVMYLPFTRAVVLLVICAWAFIMPANATNKNRILLMLLVFSDDYAITRNIPRNN